MKRSAFVLVAFMLLASTAQGQPGTLPNFVLADPSGTKHASQVLVQKGMVLVVTAPTLHDEKAQKGWDEYLTKTMPEGGMLVFLEDMSVSAFKGIARKDMRKDWKAGVPPLLLLDENGVVRKKLGVARDETAVLVYDASGSLVYVDQGMPSEASARVIWAKLQKQS